MSSVLEATKIDYIDVLIDFIAKNTILKVKTISIVSVKKCVSKLAKIVKELEKSSGFLSILIDFTLM